MAPYVMDEEVWLQTSHSAVFAALGQIWNTMPPTAPHPVSDAGSEV